MRNSIFLIKIVLFVLLVVGSVNFIIDPYFHYRKPIKLFAYPIEFQRYQNDGIVKNFDYDSIITGSSMCENFKTTELDTLFNTNSIKVPNSGGSFKEMNNLIKVAYESGHNIKIVVRGLDYGRMVEDKDSIRYDKEWYPWYLYDANLLNDVKYLINKGTFWSSISVLINSVLGNDTTSFDDYSNWSKDYAIGKEHVVFSRIEKSTEISYFTKEDHEIEKGNIYQNVVQIAEEHPETDFYYFFTPYSIVYFYNIYQQNSMEKQFASEREAIELMLKYDNIYLFSFFDDFDLICDLNNYKDITHYGEHINSYILNCMKNDEHRLTSRNYEEYLSKIASFYSNYDYDVLFEE